MTIWTLAPHRALLYLGVWLLFFLDTVARDLNYLDIDRSIVDFDVRLLFARTNGVMNSYMVGPERVTLFTYVPIYMHLDQYLQE